MKVDVTPPPSMAGEDDTTPTTDGTETTSTNGEDGTTPTTDGTETTSTTGDNDTTPTTDDIETTPTTNEGNTDPTSTAGEDDETAIPNCPVASHLPTIENVIDAPRLVSRRWRQFQQASQDGLVPVQPIRWIQGEHP